jgi:hypothetical protein
MYSDYVHFWEKAKLLATPKAPWELHIIGNCGSPLETEKGWLLITHGVGTMAALLTTAPFAPAPVPKTAADANMKAILDKMELTIDGDPVTAIETVAQPGVQDLEVVYVTAAGNRASFPMPEKNL